MNNIEFIKVLNEAAKQVEILATVLRVPSSNFRIGGSLALRAIIPEFYYRDIHDIDIIINVSDEHESNRIIKQLNALESMMFSSNAEISVDKLSYAVGTITVGRKHYTRNIIVDTCPQNLGDCTPFMWGTNGCIYIQDPRRIRFAKQSYTPVRQKDLNDITNILNWEIEQDILPF